MPRYIVQRPFPEGLHLPAAGGGADLCREVIEHNAQDSTTWISSFVTEDKTRTFCVYDAPAPRGGPQRRRPQRATGRRDQPSSRARPLLLHIGQLPIRQPA